MSDFNGKQIEIGSRSLAVSGDLEQDWFIGWSPNQNSMAAEGPWQEWVLLARAILEVNESRQLTFLHCNAQQPQR